MFYITDNDEATSTHSNAIADTDTDTDADTDITSDTKSETNCTQQVQAVIALWLNVMVQQNILDEPSL